MTPLRAGVVYFAILFAAGFVLGTFRVLVLEAALGPLAATLAELPVILLISYLAANWLVSRFALRGKGSQALATGAVAFVLLQSAELILGLTLRDMSFTDFLGNWAQTAGALGLVAQLAAALLPFIISRRA